MIYVFNLVALGGTFDILHRGHDALISKAFQIGKKVIIGLTSDDFASKLVKEHDVYPYDVRERNLVAYLNEKGWKERYEVFELNDPYGPTVIDRDIDALVVSEETLRTGLKINEIRHKKGFPHLVIVVVDMVLAEDGLPISTTRIRKGIIDREGHLIKKITKVEDLL
ncbi:MAG: phosphopantetheine adenylyltransferase [Candidatus Odinarchaeota archaeon]|nr:phosphopantetheine adenylyltransferase [Candidatus Odinarchaeota archaeon]